MNKRNWMRILLCLCLILCTVFSLCACPGPTVPTPGPDDPENPNGPEDPNNPGNPITPSGKPVPDAYPNGGAVVGAGATLTPDSPAMKATTFDPATATDIAAADFFASTPEAGKVYRVADEKVIVGEKGVYDGNGAILIAPQGLVIDRNRLVTLKNLVLIGPLSVVGSDEVTIENVEVVSSVAALTVDSASELLRMSDCRLTGTTAIALGADDTVILNSYFSFTEAGIASTAKKETVVQNCIFEGNGIGLSSNAAESIFKNLTFTMAPADIGMTLGSGTFNTLVALNTVTGAQKSIALSGVDNTSVVLCSVVSMEANENQHLYICDNQMGGRLTANSNNYFLADNNSVPNDEWNHDTVQTGNTNHNGNNLMNVDARPDVGADEALLPHVDKDLFLMMDRKDYVRDVTDTKNRTIDEYIATHMNSASPYVIIAPGAYKNENLITVNSAANNTTIYAYGVYLERQTKLQHGFMQLSSVENFAVKGLSVGYVAPSNVQVYVLEKKSNNQLLVVTGAGIKDEFGFGNHLVSSNSYIGLQRNGAFYPYADMTASSEIKVTTSGSVQGISTKLVTVPRDYYKDIRVGDVLTARDGQGGWAFHTSSTTNVDFKDMTIYGRGSVFTFIENENKTAVDYYRVSITTHSGARIGRSVYEKYKAIEEQYGISLDVYMDEQGNYRGSLPRISSRDAVHAVASAQGSQVTFCIFENMCDDATNQRHNNSRLHQVKDNGDGTTTLVYKRMLSSINASKQLYSPSFLCANFKTGDRVYVYTAKGQLVCDTWALSATRRDGSIQANVHNTSQGIELFSVTVATDAINKAALAGYNLTLNEAGGSYESQKVIVDNMSMASSGFKFDNSLFRNIRSRGLLIKTSGLKLQDGSIEGGIIQNVTFRNIGMACAAIVYELQWGESGTSEDLTVNRNLMDNTGFFKNQTLYAPVSVTGLGSGEISDDFLLYRNIKITNNHMINRRNDYAIYLNSVKGVVISGNTFGPYLGNDFGRVPSEGETENVPAYAICINGAKDVEISGNTYSQDDFNVWEYYVDARLNVHVFGSDVEYDGVSQIPDRTED